jgi:hypothetical protein
MESVFKNSYNESLEYLVNIEIYSINYNKILIHLDNLHDCEIHLRLNNCIAEKCYKAYDKGKFNKIIKLALKKYLAI